MKTKSQIFLALALTLPLAGAGAATKTWTGQSGGLWSTADNWSPGGAPANDDSLEFPLLHGLLFRSVTNDLSKRTFMELTFTTSGYTVRGNLLPVAKGIYASQTILGNTIEADVSLSSSAALQVRNAAASLSVSGNVDLNGRTLTVTGDGALSLSGMLMDAGSLVLAGDNTVTLSGAGSNRFDGLVWVQRGTLLLDKTADNGAVPGDLVVGRDGVEFASRVENRQRHQITDGADVHLGALGTWLLNGWEEQVGRVSGSGVIALGGASALLTVAFDSATTNFSGQITGEGNITKSGAGTWVLSGTNTTTGTTVVQDGTVLFNGRHLPGTVRVNLGGRVGGVGEVGELWSANGIVSPGESVGTLTCSNLTLQSGELELELLATGHDQLAVRGTVTLAGAARLDLSPGPGFVPTPGTAFRIIDNDGAEAVMGSFAALPEGGWQTVGTNLFQITYQGGDGNDVVLVCHAPPVEVLSTRLGGGNGDSLVDSNECGLLTVVLSNTTPWVVRINSAFLSFVTPGLALLHAGAGYEPLLPGALGTNSLPFQFSTLPGFVAGGDVELQFDLRTLTNGMLATRLRLPTGNAADGGGPCEVCPAQTVIGRLNAQSGLMAAVPAYPTVATECGSESPVPSFIPATARFDAYRLVNGETNSCVRVVVSSGRATACLVYTNEFLPTQPERNLYAQVDGYATNNTPRSLNMNLNAWQAAVVVVHGPGGGLSEEQGYQLQLSRGGCRPLLYLAPAGPGAVSLEWSTSAWGYKLEAAQTLDPLASWATQSGFPVVRAGRFSVTNLLNGTEGYHRLKR